MNILEQFKSQETFLQMTTGDRLLATVYTIILSMAVTFVALILIMYLTKLMSLIIGLIEKKPVKSEPQKVKVPEEEKPAIIASDEEDEELVAVITAAIAASLNTSMHNIVVTNITRVSDSTPTWGKLGRSDVMSSRM